MNTFRIDENWGEREIKKCIRAYSNCHREIHDGEFPREGGVLFAVS